MRLQEAAAAFFFARWGSLDVAERELHDLCVAVRAYQGSPRLRLFAAFVGQPCELDEAEAAVLQSPAAAAVYLSLVVEIHRELRSDAERTGSSLGAFAAAAAEKGPADYVHIDVLFPSAEAPQARTDKRDYWLADGELLVTAVSRWVRGQRALDDESAAAYVDLAEFVRGAATSSSGLVDVDDLLWVLMQQWAKFLSWFAHRAAAKAAWSESNSVLAKANATARSSSRPATVADKGRGRAHAVSKPPVPPAFNVAYVRSLVEALYPAGEGARVADPAYYSSRYLRATAQLGTRRIYAVDFVDALLRDCAEWDTNAGACAPAEPPGPALASLHSARSVGGGTAGSNALAAAALGLAAYRDPVKELLAEVCARYELRFF